MIRKVVILSCVLLSCCNTNESARLNNEAIRAYLSYHENKPDALELIADIEQYYTTEKAFPHHQYDYSVAKGGLFSIAFQNEEDQNRLFAIENHNSGSTKYFHGLGNVLNSLPQNTKAHRAFVGSFIIAILEDNGIPISKNLSPIEANTLFEFQPSTYHNLGRYTLEVRFRDNKGQHFWNKGIRFPELKITLKN